jgi:hypothetical protein
MFTNEDVKKAIEVTNFEKSLGDDLFYGKVLKTKTKFKKTSANGQ